MNQAASQQRGVRQFNPVHLHLNLSLSAHSFLPPVCIPRPDRLFCCIHPTVFPLNPLGSLHSLLYIIVLSTGDYRRNPLNLN